MGENDVIPLTPEEAPKEGDENIEFVKAELDKVKKDNARLGFELRKKEEAPTEEIPEEDMPVTKGELKKIISQTTRQNLEGQYEATIQRVSNSPEEAELIKYHLTNSINLTGNVEEDVDNARTIAFKGKTKQMLSELRRADKSTPGSGTGAGQRQPNHKFPMPNIAELPEAEQSKIRYYGMIWDADTGEFKIPEKKK